MSTGEQLQLDGAAANLAAATAPHRADYREHVETILAGYVRERREFSAEDVRRALPDGVEPHSHNVLPSIIRAWAHRGLIEPIGWVRCTRPARHANVNRVWKGTGCGVD